MNAVQLELSLDQVDQLRAFDAGATDSAEITSDVAARYRVAIRRWKSLASDCEQLRFLSAVATELCGNVKELIEFAEWFQDL